jgi:hypothetical protein
MTEFAARIGRIRLKGGGADVRVLHIRRDLISNEEARDVFNEMFEWRDGA